MASDDEIRELQKLGKDVLIKRAVDMFQSEAHNVVMWNAAYLGVFGGVSLIARSHFPKLGPNVTPAHGLLVGALSLTASAAMAAGIFYADWERLTNATAIGNGVSAFGLMASGIMMNKQSRVAVAALTTGVQCMSFGLMESNVLSDYENWKRKAGLVK